ncbi:hypothetical protein F511_34433 [Dorcoceras hygrometricum]|uniref:Uncharacterized protein n=1 Tax=Dorcoceras hygrometricum TaxID=472368 RepID=A0A2Z7CDG0_9LAMI|nr:hypothetical protein F511_34433 [Dorcoceras hygrometricum]
MKKSDNILPGIQVCKVYSISPHRSKLAMIRSELKKSTVAEHKRAGRDKLRAFEKSSKLIQQRTSKLIKKKTVKLVQQTSKLIQLRAKISRDVISPAQRPTIAVVTCSKSTKPADALNDKEHKVQLCQNFTKAFSMARNLYPTDTSDQRLYIQTMNIETKAGGTKPQQRASAKCNSRELVHSGGKWFTS